MLSRTRARHHVVVAYLALFVALGGSAVAAKPLIDGADVQDDSLTGSDIVETSLSKVGDANTLDGRDSTAFFNAAQNVRSEATTVAPGGHGSATVSCPSGTVVTGGGHTQVSGFIHDYRLLGEAESGNGWHVRVYNDSATDPLSFRAYARCAYGDAVVVSP